MVSLETPNRLRTKQRLLHSQVLEMGGVACKTTWKNTRTVRRQETEAGGSLGHGLYWDFPRKGKAG